jgi:thiol:disulfide interchange protein DsbA
MSRSGRSFHWLSLLASLIVVSLLLPASVSAQHPQDEFFLEGAQYRVLSPPIPARAPEGKVEVVELFWYRCPHCYHLEPYLEQWLANKPEAASFVRVPALLNPHWVVQARAYYAAELLGAVDRTHVPLFKAIHEKKQALNDVDSLAAFYAAHGVDEQKFRDAFNSFEVHTKLRQAAQYKRNDITGVPAMIVGGKYLVTATMAGGHPEMLKVVDYLVRREAAE